MVKSSSIQEIARWKSTTHKREWTEKEIAEIETNYGDDELFVHYDDGVATSTGLQPQATFNPKTDYRTPIGIYCYPWHYAKDKIFGSGGLPFAQDKQYMYLYAAKDKSKILRLQNVFQLGLLEKTIDYAINNLGLEKEQIFKKLKLALLDSRYVTFESDTVTKKILGLFYDEDKSFVTKSLEKIKKLSGLEVSKIPKTKDITRIAENRNKSQYTSAWWYFMNNIHNGNQSRVTHYLQNKLNYGIITDDLGWGVIAVNEDTQSIILNPAFAKLVGVKINPSDKRNKEVNPFKKIKYR